MLGLMLGLMPSLMLVAGPAGAQDTGAAVSAERPGAGGPADPVRVTVGLLDISKVDEAEQVFFIDAYMLFEWTDDRLATASGTAGSPDSRQMPLDAIWNPGLLVVNGRSLETRLPWVATIDGRGNVTVRQRVSGPLAVDLDLREFPFDTQRLTLDFVSYLHTPSELVFSADSRLIARIDRFSAEGWSFAPADPETSVFRLAEDGPGAPSISFAISAERSAAFYILTLVMPLTLVVLLSWVVHWVPPDLIAARVGMASATVFSLIALSVTFRLTLPQIDYLTRADRFVIYTTALLAVSLCVAVAAANLVQKERHAAALRLTRVTRLAFPFGYLLAIGFALLP
jgi:hypothetical protein